MANPHQLEELKLKIVTKEEIERRIQTKWPNQPFEIIQYTKVSQPFSIKCLKCGRIKKYSSFSNFYSPSKSGICICQFGEDNLQKKHLDNQQQVLELISKKDNLKFVSFQNRKSTGKPEVTCYCSKCRQNFTKTIQNFLEIPKCFYCESRENMNTQGYQAGLNEEYELLEDFVNRDTRLLVRHKPCGFIWKMKPKHLNNYQGCPKCNKSISKGEQRVARYLTEKGYEFEAEKSFSWQTNSRRRYDFFVPKFKLIVEYMGQQHYFETNYFKIPYEQQKIIDKEKKQEALENGYNYLEIGYFDFNKVEEILDSWFNDYSARK